MLLALPIALFALAGFAALVIDHNLFEAAGWIAAAGVALLLAPPRRR